MNGRTVSFNFGGYRTTFAIETIKEFGGPVLNALISEKFSVSRGNDELFIDRSPEEGQIVSNFIRAKVLPDHCYDTYAKAAADYFDLPEILDALDARIPKWSSFRQWERKKGLTGREICKVHSDPYACREGCLRQGLKIPEFTLRKTKCPECTDLGAYRLLEAMEHLIEKHGAKIEAQCGTNDGEWGISYRVRQ